MRRGKHSQDLERVGRYAQLLMGLSESSGQEIRVLGMARTSRKRDLSLVVPNGLGPLREQKRWLIPIDDRHDHGRRHAVGEARIRLWVQKEPTKRMADTRPRVILLWPWQ